MAFKAHIWHALKTHGLPISGLLILILGLIMMLSLTPNLNEGHQKEVALMTAITAKKAPTKGVPAPAEKETDDKKIGVVAVLKETAPQELNSEMQNPKAYSPDVNTSEPVTESSPEQLVYLAESAFADDLSVQEKLAVIRSLENIDDPMVVDPVMIAMGDQDPDLRNAALEVLRGMDNEEINEAFLAGLGDDNYAVTEKAMDIIADGDSPNILPSLEGALMDSDEKIQKIAIATLEDIYDVRAVDLLLDTGLLNANEAIRNEVIDSLEFITSQRFESYQDAKIWWELNRDTFEFN